MVASKVGGDEELERRVGEDESQLDLSCVTLWTRCLFV